MIPANLAMLLSLKFLNISNNKFEVFPSALCGIPALLDLDISFNAITTLPDEIAAMSTLERFVMIGNDIQVLPSSFSNLARLQELDCRRCNLSNLAPVITLPNLRRLLAERNSIHSVEGPFTPALTALDISHNSLSQLSLKTIANESTQLTSLTMTCAKLAAIPSEMFTFMPHLTSLHLEENSLAVLPESIKCLTHLTELSCHNNQLTSLPQNIGELQKLRVCLVYCNNLQALPDSIWRCSSLQTLNASSNLMTAFPLPSIKDDPLVASPRQDTQMWNAGGPDPIATPLAISLLNLYLCDNRLVDDVFEPVSYLTNLKLLNVAFNDIFEVPHGRLANCAALEELYLSGNKLTSLPADDLAKMTKLRIINANSNKLQTLPAELARIQSLNVLDVGNNVLKYNIANWPYDWNWYTTRYWRYHHTDHTIGIGICIFIISTSQAMRD